MLTDFQNSFTSRLSNKFLTKQYQNFSPYLKRVATLPCCKILMSEKKQQPEAYNIMINDTSQRNVAT